MSRRHTHIGLRLFFDNRAASRAHRGRGGNRRTDDIRALFPLAGVAFYGEFRRVAANGKRCPDHYALIAAISTFV